MLSPDELERAQRLADDRVRARWVAARAFLRRTLGPVTGLDPADLRFEYGAAGKPALAGGPEFSLAHSGDYALLAFTPAAAVGADLEQVRPELAGTADRYFSPQERGELARLDHADRVERFFALWTLKEAYLKATGEGVRPALLGEVPSSGWVSERPPLPAGYAGAVVVLEARAVFDFG